ncbi:hypothetical protein [Nocardia sp. IFM 10818]
MHTFWRPGSMSPITVTPMIGHTIEGEQQVNTTTIHSGLLVLDFRATLTQAQNFLAALDDWSATLHATIDNDVSPDPPALPCSSLWD